MGNRNELTVTIQGESALGEGKVYTRVLWEHTGGAPSSGSPEASQNKQRKERRGEYDLGHRRV